MADLITNSSQKNSTDNSEIILDIKQNDITNKQEKKGLNLNEIFASLNNWVIEQSEIKTEEKLLFFELLHAILNAGVSITEALRLLSRQIENPRLKIIVEDMLSRIESGESLAESMRHSPDVFDKATCSIIAAGEKSGKLNEVLTELVSQYERMDSIQKKVKSVMMYPIIVITVMILLTIVVMLFVVPKLIDLFGSAENLPIPTQILIYGSDLLTQKWPILLAGVIAFTGAFITWKKSKIGQWQSAQIVLYLPILGEFVKKIALTRFTRIFSFLINSGVPIIEGLRISSKVTGNQVYEKKLLLAADDLTRGIEISENFSDDTRLFPNMLVRMMSIGEKTASMGTILNKLADFYDEELDRKVGMISKLMEPLIMMMMAAGAIFLILAIYMPILSMNDQVMG